jgi:three-Cys-motif partner protein
MDNPAGFKFDEIGYWSEIKLDIIREYASAYSTIMAAQRNPSLFHVYIDAFAGAGIHRSKSRHELVSGSPLNALEVQPPFRAYHFIDIESEKVENLRQMIGPRVDVFLYRGDCNKILVEKVFPQVAYEQYKRGLCILDPYSLHLDWSVIERAGRSRAMDVFLNFPVADMNRNVLWRDPHEVSESQKARLTAFWGDDSWRDVAYQPNLFGDPDKLSNETIAQAFKMRLQKVAGFARVPNPIPMRNSRGATVYYLFFASQKDIAEQILLYIFGKYEHREER